VLVRKHRTFPKSVVAAKQSLEARYTRVNKLKEDRCKQTQAVELHNKTETQHLRAQRLKLTSPTLRARESTRRLESTTPWPAAAPASSPQTCSRG